MAAATNAVASSPLAICIQGVSLASQFPATGRRSSRSDGTRTQGQDPSPGVPPSAFLSTCPASSAVFASRWGARIPKRIAERSFVVNWSAKVIGPAGW